MVGVSLEERKKSIFWNENFHWVSRFGIANWGGWLQNLMTDGLNEIEFVSVLASLKFHPASLSPRKLHDSFLLPPNDFFLFQWKMYLDLLMKQSVWWWFDVVSRCGGACQQWFHSTWERSNPKNPHSSFFPHHCCDSLVVFVSSWCRWT